MSDEKVNSKFDQILARLNSEAGDALRISLSAKRIARGTGYSVWHVERWGEEPKRLGHLGSGSPVPGAAIPIITEETGDLTMIKSLCVDCGGLFIEAPRPTQIEDVAVTVKEFGEFLSSVGGRGEICSGDSDIIRKEGREAAASILGLIMRCER